MVDGWYEVRLGDIAEVDRSSLGPKIEPDFEFEYISLSNVEPGRITGPLEKFKFADAPSRARRIVKEGDILVSTVRPNLLGFTRVDSNHRQCIASTGFAVITSKKSFDGLYIFHFLFSCYMKAQLHALTVGSSYPAINSGDLKKLRIIVPPLPEQHKIAKILSTWDQAIEAVEKLIANSRVQKKTLMQQLFSGKVRLLGYSDPWRICWLGQIGSFAKGKGIRRDQVTDSGFPCVLYGEIYTRHDDFVREFHSFINPTVAKTSKEIKCGDLLFAGSGETSAEIGKCIAYLGDERVYGGGDIVIFSPERSDSKFLVYLMNWAPMAAQKARVSQGKQIVHISVSNLSKIKFHLPEIDEQKTISRLLSEVDEITISLRKQLHHLKTEKKALMQQLLTGRRRVIVEDFV